MFKAFTSFDFKLWYEMPTFHVPKNSHPTFCLFLVIYPISARSL